VLIVLLAGSILNLVLKLNDIEIKINNLYFILNFQYLL